MQAKLHVLAPEKLISYLQKCRQEKNLQHALRLHAYLQQHRLDAHPVLGNYLVPMLVECGVLSLARHVFDRLTHRNEHSWTSLISGYLESGEVQHAFLLYHKMQQDYIEPNRYTYLVTLNACARLKETGKGQGIHADIVRKGLELDLYIGNAMVGNALVDMYSKCGMLADAHQVFNSMPARDAVTWNTLITGYTENCFGWEAMHLFQQMQLKGISPVFATFICSLKACSITGTLEIGLEIHEEVTKRGIEGELHMGSALVDMYIKCGCLTDAQRTLDQMPLRDAVSWNALITGFAEHGAGRAVLNSYKLMQLESVCTDAITFSLCLKACATLSALGTGEIIHGEVISRGFETDLFLGNTLVDFYATCGLFAEAKQVLHYLPLQNAASWNALMAGYAEHGLAMDVLKCFRRMQLEGVSPNAITFLCTVKACGSIGSLKIGQDIHCEVIKSGLERESHMGNTLLDMYGKCTALADALHVFKRMPVHDKVSWNALSAGFAEHGLAEEILNCYKQMKLEGVPADAVTFVSCLKACGFIEALEAGRVMHSEINKLGLEGDLLLSTELVDMYGLFGSVAEAHKVFDQLRVQDLVLWDTLMAGYAECGLCEEAEECIHQMQVKGISPDLNTFIYSLKACSIKEDLQTGRQLHHELTNRGLETELSVGSALVDMYGKCNSLAEAHQLFDNLPAQGPVSWTALIAGYIEHGLDEEALKCFRQMQLEGVYMDFITFVLSLKACGAVGALETGRAIHVEVTKKAFGRELHVGSTLVDMYGKCGSLAEARRVFDRLPVRTAVAWTALIAGYAQHGCAEDALNCFKEMQLEGVLADSITYVLCLKACGSTGALDTGREIHAELSKVGLERETMVSNMLVDMYGKCGLVEEGQKVFDRLPIHTVVSWTAIIKAYGENHDGKMAIECFKLMVEQGVKPNSVTFTCLLAACSQASMVIEGQEYYKAMSEEHGVEQTLDHYACMVDLFARSGHILEAERFFAAIQCPPSNVVVMALLTACKSYGQMELGQRCFQHLVKLNQDDACAYLLMGDLCATIDRWYDANTVRVARKYAQVKKRPGTASIEVNKILHEFVVSMDLNETIAENFYILNSHMKDEGYIPHVALVLEHVNNEEKEVISNKFVDRFSVTLNDNTGKICIVKSNCTSVESTR